MSPKSTASFNILLLSTGENWGIFLHENERDTLKYLKDILKCVCAEVQSGQERPRSESKSETKFEIKAGVNSSASLILPMVE